MSEESDERISRIEARRRRREQRRLSLDTDEENKSVNGVDDSGVPGGGRSRSSTTDSDIELTKALSREEKRQERREKKRQREMAEKCKEPAKSAAVITDFSKREIRERRPSDPEILSGGSESVDDTDKENEQINAQKSGGKKSGYGSYASALRKGSQGADVDKRKERYAAAIEGYNVRDDDDDDIMDYSSRDPTDQQPDIKSTAPVKRIKEDYLTSASGAGRKIEHSEEQPTPHHLERQWPPPPSENDDDDEKDGEPRQGVVKTFEEPEAVEEDRGVDVGHVDSVKSLKEQWQVKEPSKPLGVNKPYVPLKKDDLWITHFRPVIDEGEAPKEPQWLQTVRQRRWRSTVAARFPQDEQEKAVFENRSTTPRKFKKPNPYSLMRSKSDLDDEFEIAMRRRRRKTDDEDSVDASKRSWSSFGEADNSDSVAVLSKVPIKGPLKEYKKNLELERARTTMLKWTFSTDMVDDPLRFDLPKPIDLATQEDYEKEQEWRYMQSRRRFASESETDGLGDSSMRSSMSSLSDGEHLPKSPVFSTPGQPLEKTSISSGESPSPEPTADEHAGPADSAEPARDYMFSQGVSDIKKNLLTSTKEEPLKPTIADDNLEYVPKLADIKKKMQEKEESIPKSTPLNEEIQMLPKMKDIKNRFLAPKKEQVLKNPEFEEGEQFERLESLKSRFQAKEQKEEPRALSKPKLKKKLSTSDDMKAIMASRRQMTDEFVSESPDTAQEIKSLATDIAKTFGSEVADSPKQKKEKRKKGKEEKKKAEVSDSGTEESETPNFGPCGKPEGCGTDDELEKRSSKELEILPTLGNELNEEPEPIYNKGKVPLAEYGPCGKPEGCGTDDELEKRFSKELDILPTLGNELNEEPEPIYNKDKVLPAESTSLESAPQRDSFTDDDQIEHYSTTSDDDKIKKQESLDTVETSAKESETESEAEMHFKKEDKDTVEDGDEDFLSSESENDKDEEDGPSEAEIDGNLTSRSSTDRPLSYTMEDNIKKRLIKEDDERPKSFAFGEGESTEDPCITSK